MSEHSIEEMFSREWKVKFKGREPGDFAMTTTDEDGTVVPSYRGIYLTRHLLRATIAIFHIFGKQETTGYEDPRANEENPPRNLFSTLYLTYQSFGESEGSDAEVATNPSKSMDYVLRKAYIDEDQPTFFDEIKSQQDNETRRYIWVARVSGKRNKSYREYRASSLIKETVALLESFPDYEINVLTYFFISLRRKEEPSITKQWKKVLNSAVQFRRWILAVFLAPQNVLGTFETENFKKDHCCNEIGRESDFMALNDGIADAKVKIGDESTFHVNFHVERMEFWMNNSAECAFPLIKFMRFFHKFAVVQEIKPLKKRLRKFINRHISAIMILHKKYAHPQGFHDIFKESTDDFPHIFLNTIQRFLSLQDLARHEKSMITKYDFDNEELMEEINRKLWKIDFLINVESVYFLHIRDQRLKAMVKQISADRKILADSVKQWIFKSMVTGDEEVSDKKRNNVIRRWMKVAVQFSIPNWKEIHAHVSELNPLLNSYVL